jgi:hypothetical protein
MAPQFFCIKLAFNTFLSICLTKLVMDMDTINGLFEKARHRVSINVLYIYL